LRFPHWLSSFAPPASVFLHDDMTLTAHEAWTRLLDRARQELPEQTYKTWLEPTEALSMTDGVVFVGAPDQFAADWNQSKHADMLSSLAPVALGHPLADHLQGHRRTPRSATDGFVCRSATTAATDSKPAWRHYIATIKR
jgi:chromosomal replication initiator protein